MSITPIVTETGLISLSMDALGTLNSTGSIRVDKPVGATVRAAYLMSATIPGGTISNGDVSLNGTPISFTSQATSNFSTTAYFANVTSIIKPLIDAAPGGAIALVPVGEGSKSSIIDGEVLAVIFNDPNQPASNTVVLMFGAQNTTGDTFSVLLSDPINKSNPNFGLDMSLGISYGFQSSGQYSQIDVNGQRLTTSAGGQDDGTGNNGALITVGGIGDTNANPANPFQTDSGGPRYDDELYNLLPFVNNGDTTISVKTLNPSNNDHIFFAALNVKGATAVVGEGIILSPATATNLAGTQTSVTATLQNTLGQPLVNKSVTFTITSGPNAGNTFTSTTDSNGKLVYTYTSNGTAGTDKIVASFVSSTNTTITSSTVDRIWTPNNTDTTPPKVTEVRAYYGNAAHPNLFVNLLDPANARNLPWFRINRLAVVFSENVVVDQADFSLTGMSAVYAPIGFTYDSSSFMATWTLATELRADKLILTLDGDSATGITDTSGNKLAGNNTTAGTDYSKSFRVLSGDFDNDNDVDLYDQVKVRNVMNSDASAPTSSIFGDVDGDGDVDSNDIVLVRSRNNSTLPL